MHLGIAAGDGSAAGVALCAATIIRAAGAHDTPRPGTLSPRAERSAHTAS